MNKPCAYCGKSDTPRHNGHVISKSLYPSLTPNQVQRPTVPECETCKAIWTDAETQFRNILVIAGNPNDAVHEKWDTVLRSFEKPSGRKWVLDLFDSMIPVDSGTGPRHMVYPYKDPRVNLVLRKIVRGLSAYHGLGETIPDENVWAGYVPDKLSYPIRNEMLHYNLGDTFVQYGYALFDDEIGIQSGWLIRFYGSRDFMGIISKFGDAKETFGPIFTP